MKRRDFLKCAAIAPIYLPSSLLPQITPGIDRPDPIESLDTLEVDFFRPSPDQWEEASDILTANFEEFRATHALNTTMTEVEVSNEICKEMCRQLFKDSVCSYMYDSIYPDLSPDVVRDVVFGVTTKPGSFYVNRKTGLVEKKPCRVTRMKTYGGFSSPPPLNQIPDLVRDLLIEISCEIQGSYKRGAPIASYVLRMAPTITPSRIDPYDYSIYRTLRISYASFTD